jgi:hypothetical protein
MSVLDGGYSRNLLYLMEVIVYSDNSKLIVPLDTNHFPRRV